MSVGNPQWDVLAVAKGKKKKKKKKEKELQRSAMGTQPTCVFLRVDDEMPHRRRSRFPRIVFIGKISRNYYHIERRRARRHTIHAESPATAAFCTQTDSADNWRKQIGYAAFLHAFKRPLQRRGRRRLSAGGGGGGVVGRRY